MDSKRRLNVEIDKCVYEFKSMLKEFKLKRKKIVFRGKGLEFDGYRNFVFDDDAEFIDWKASLRAQKLLVKTYKDEGDSKILFLIDVGSNMVFGSTEKIKCEFATELIAVFADLILSSEDKIGFLLFNDVVKPFLDCKGGEKHFRFFMDVLSDGSNYGGKTNLDQALDFAINSFDRSVSLVIIVSDFLGITEGTFKRLNFLSHKFETIAIQIRDPLDITLPEIDGEIVLEDSSNSSQVVINPKIINNAYEKYAFEQEEKIKQFFGKLQVDYLNLVTDKFFAPSLAVFLRERARKF
jgi:uncharacterized protein (DUF58 family)